MAKLELSKEKLALAKVAQRVFDDITGIIGILPSVQLEPEDKRIHPSWIAKYLADALAIALYLKSPVDTEDGTFARNLLLDTKIKEFQDAIEKEFKENGFDYEVKKS